MRMSLLAFSFAFCLFGFCVHVPTQADPQTDVDSQIDRLVQRGLAQLRDHKLSAPPGDNVKTTLDQISPLITKSSPAAQQKVMALLAAIPDSGTDACTSSPDAKPTPSLACKPRGTTQPEATRLVQPPPPQPNIAVPSPPSPQPAPTPKQPLLDVAPLLARGDAALARGQIADARNFYRLAANNGSAEAARRMAQTWDPIYLAQQGAVGIQGDPQQAQHWLDRARQLDSK